MQRLSHLVLLGVVFGLAACGGSPKETQEKAVAAALAAVQAQDAKAFIEVMPSVSDLETLCPKRAERMKRKLAEVQNLLLLQEGRILKKIRDCADIDWKGAKTMAHRGGEFRSSMSDDCGSKLGKHKDIRVVYLLADGRRAEIKLDDPVGVEGGYFAFTDEPRCKLLADDHPAP
jgi:hypothetical protein